MISNHHFQLAWRSLSVAVLSLSLSACFNLTVVHQTTESSARAKADAVSAEVRQALAPSGVLRVGVYPGSPTSWVKDPKTGESVGIALDLGKGMAKRLDVPVQVVEFDRVAQVLDALKDGKVDMTFTNATAVRAKDMDFTEPLVRLELGYLVIGASPLQSINEIDQAGMRVGVSQGSSSQGVLTQRFKWAKVVPAESLAKAQTMLNTLQIDAFATNKGILFEMSDALPGSRVLSGRWGLENLAIAIPKGREVGRPFVDNFAKEVTRTGELDKAVQRSGLRGTARD
ncbi:MAG: ABC transporter substrate-binding protein [Betaproteobacteria bacterium]|jgi:polar amino acid transport system substrate-binding protein|nr:ABC transporter substrate-binding protein [Betaproteobacteria bacterium]NBZ98246.1 ABC transporter substrate-binding protein [Betaproteobacteria bacterium]NDD01225.1 ABC transporter substrate-binding protein [Betaproteobacteria bacterium]NDE23946.1 ABC transporter substrate-binding protein [Betaproteobacteria bacterium]